MSVLDGKKFSSDKRDNPTYPFNVGMNVSELLGIVKYEPPVSAQLMGMAKGSFPSFIPKTDETRVQSAPDVLNEIIGKNCYISVKMDGSSGTFYFSHGEFGVCSRNIEFKPEDTSTFSKVAVKYDLKAKMQSLGRNIAIQGEVCGPSIQKNRLELKEHDLFVFNVYDIDKGSYISVKEAKDIVESIGLKFVPIEYIGEFNRLWDVPTLLVMAKGKYPNTNNNREGIVIRPVYEAYSPSLKGRLSFKVINNDYLLSGGD
jgi:RNA ligase (TIGR02306 family)